MSGPSWLACNTGVVIYYSSPSWKHLVLSLLNLEVREQAQGGCVACSESHSCVAQRGGLEHSTAFLFWDLSALPHCGGCGTW